MSDIFVGETVWEDGTIPLPPIHVDEPTLTMDFLVNDSPFMGRDGKLVTSRNIMDRLARELETNVWLKVDFDQDVYKRQECNRMWCSSYGWSVCLDYYSLYSCR